MSDPQKGAEAGLWLHDRVPAAAPPLRRREQADVLIVGGGLCGWSIAAALVEAGLAAEQLILLEAGDCGRQASGRNAGMLSAEIGEPYARLRAGLGERAARLRRLAMTGIAAHRTRLAALHRTKSTRAESMEEHGILLVAANEAEAVALRDSARVLATDGFESRWLEPPAAGRKLGAACPHGALFDPAGAGVDPMVLLEAWRAPALRAGLRVFERSPVLELERDGERCRARTPEAEVYATRVVLACNAYAPGIDPSLSPMIHAVRGQVMSLPPIRERVLHAVVSRNHGFEYFRQRTDGRFLFGGRRYLDIHREYGSELRLHDRIQAGLLSFARELYPQLAGLEPEFRWSGVMGFSCDGLPLVGPHPHRPEVLLCLGFHGRGLALIPGAARIVADLLLEGKAADADLFSPRRMLA